MPVDPYPYWMKRPAGATFQRLEKIRDIVDDEGRCTVRRVLYKLYPQKHGRDKKYNTTIKDVVRARILGMIPWEAILEAYIDFHDGTGWDDVDEYLNRKTDLEELADAYCRDRTPCHLRHIAVFFEKNTVVESFRGVCNEYDIPWVSTRGQLTWTEKNKSATERFQKGDLILYFGDNDEKGREIYDVIKRDLRYRGCGADMKWVAVTDDQEEKYGFSSGARIDEFKTSDLTELVEETILEYIDQDVYNEIVAQEAIDQERIRKGTLTLEIPEEDET